MNDISSARVSLMISCVFLLILCKTVGLAASSLALNGLNRQNTLMFPSPFFYILMFYNCICCVVCEIKVTIDKQGRLSNFHV